MKLISFKITDGAISAAWTEETGRRQFTDKAPGRPELHEALRGILGLAICSLGVPEDAARAFCSGCEVCGIKVAYKAELPQVRFVLRRCTSLSTDCSIIQTPYRPLYPKSDKSDRAFCYESGEIDLINNAFNEIASYVDGVGRQMEIDA